MNESFPGHKCQLIDFRSDTNLPRLLPTASWIQKIVHYLQASIIVSRRNPITARNFFSHAAIAKENRRLAKLPYTVIHPCSHFSAIWYIFVLVAYAVYLPIIPYIFVFYIHTFTITKYFAPTLAVFTSTILYLEVLIKLNSGYYDYENEMFVLNRSKIRANYLMSTLFPDIISAFPMPLIVRLSPQLDNWETRLLIIFFVCFLFHFFNIPKMLRYYDVISVYFDFTSRIDLVIKLGFGSFYALHMLALAGIIISDFLMSESEWYEFACKKWDCNNPFVIYANAFLETVESFFACGYSEVGPLSIYENSVTIFILFFGWIFKATITIILIKVVMSHHRSESRYYGFINEAKDYCRKYNLPDNLTANIYMYIEHKFRNNYFNEDQIGNTLSGNLKTEIIMDRCKKLTEEMDIFKNLPVSIIKQIMQYFKREIYMAGEIIIQENTEVNKMFFLASGSAVAVSHSGQQIDMFEDGAYFGEISLLLDDAPINVSIIATEYCEMFILSKDDLLMVIKPNTSLLKEMQNVARDRIHKMKHGSETLYEKF